jgi:hypothetical protein
MYRIHGSNDSPLVYPPMNDAQSRSRHRVESASSKPSLPNIIAEARTFIHAKQTADSAGDAADHTVYRSAYGAAFGCDALLRH